jgi:lipopolysaccharide export LptBFGC system permease protein LptF
MTFAFPFAMIVAVDAIRTHRGVSPQLERAAVLKLAAFAVVFMLAFDGWVVPAANQAWRVAMTPPGTGAPLRGMRELTTWELMSNSDRATVYAPGTALASKSISIRRELSARTALLTLPLVLAWRRWGALSRRTRLWYAPLPVSVATIGTIAVFVACSSLGATIERQGAVPFSVAFWLPTLTLIIAGTLGRLARRHEATS